MGREGAVSTGSAGTLGQRALHGDFWKKTLHGSLGNGGFIVVYFTTL